MKERFIEMTAESVKRTMAGLKTMTRRLCHDNGDTLIGYEYVINRPTTPEFWKGKKSDPYTGWIAKFKNLPIAMPRPSRYGEPGDLLWVKESWAYHPHNPDEIIYKATYDGPFYYLAKWKGNRFMRKDDARLWLQVIGYRFEPVQAITPADAMAEGIVGPGPVRQYADLWDKMHGAGAWKRNEWVCVITYKLLSVVGRPADPLIENSNEQLLSIHQ